MTRTLASVVPPSPLATRWKLVELEGETVWVPLTLDLADAVDGYGGGVRGAPVEDDGLAEIDGEGIGGDGVAVGGGRLRLGSVSARVAGRTMPLDFLWQPVATAERWQGERGMSLPEHRCGVSVAFRSW